MKNSYDILIIGGGLVGASLACALGPTGLRIGVVEAVSPGGDKQSFDERTLALAYGSRRIFEGLGLWGEIETAGAEPIRHIHISDRGHFGVARLHAAEAGLPALGYVVASLSLGSVLIDSLRQRQNIHWLCPATLEVVDITADAARVEVDHDGKRLSLSARLLVAADGVNSPVREAVGIKARQMTYGQHAIVTTVGLDRSHEHTAYERFTDSGPLALLPMSGRRCAVVWSARQGDVDAIMALEDDAFLARLQRRFGGRLGRFNKIGKRRTYPLKLTCVDEHVRARLALIGNAAHTVHPVAGQGFNLGLRDIATLSEILCDEGRAGRDIGDLQVLRRYAAWRRRDNRVIANFTDGLIRLFSNDFFPLIALRGLGLVAVDLLPPVKRGLTRITSGLSGRQPRLARGLPLA